MKFRTRGYAKSPLIDNIAKGDEKAFRLLFDMYYQQLFHHAFYYLSSKEQAEEAVSDVFFIIWKKRETLDKIENIESYLYTSVKNQALHYIRRANEPEKDSLELYHIEILSDGNDPERKLLDQERRELVQNAINSLPNKCREVFRLAMSDKLKHKEIAKLLDISEKTVEAHVATAYKKIQNYVRKLI